MWSSFSRRGSSIDYSLPYRPEMVEIVSGFERGAYYSSRPGSPDSSSSTHSGGSSSPLLSQPQTPFTFPSPGSSFSASSPFFTSTPRLTRSVRRTLGARARSGRAIYVAIVVLGVVALTWRERDREVVQSGWTQVQKVATRAREERCRYMPWLAACPDPFEGLSFDENYGELVYPAVALPSNHSSASPARAASQPHPIHRLIRDAESAWHRKVTRQSQTLEEAVAEYRRRYKQAPPRGFDLWFRFAQEHNVQLVDEHDSIHERMQPFTALRPEVLQERSGMLQGNVLWENETFWLHQHTVTLRIGEKGQKITADGPMRETNHRADQVMALLEGISQFLPDLNITITGHDVPWVVLGSDHKQQHIEAAENGEYLDDFETFKDDWAYDGWQLMCPSDSPMRQAAPFGNRTDWTASETTSFIGTDHVQAMDMCYHPENQVIHGYTAWNGPRPGILFPMFSFSTTSLNSDLLLPPLEQYERPVGPDLPWAEKPYNKVVWRGSTTGSDLTQAIARKYSQRVRLARLPKATGELTVPYAPNYAPNYLGKVEHLTRSAADFADEYLDVQFMGAPAQCGTAAECANFEHEFEWDAFMSEEEQNKYRYVLDVDGNGWSGRFHRLMASNSLVLKSTIFPEWFADRVQPWVHYVPIKTDYTDLYPTMAFFKGYDGVGAHEDLAERIATAGRLWAEQYWRWEDMQAYMFRLLLEYARVMKRDWSYTNMDYVPPAPPVLVQ
ncbi:hypothetical protein JCM8097_004685 [Rhodosporidiobolus ruineniae]